MDSHLRLGEAIRGWRGRGRQAVSILFQDGLHPWLRVRGSCSLGKGVTGPSGFLGRSGIGKTGLQKAGLPQAPGLCFPLGLALCDWTWWGLVL